MWFPGLIEVLRLRVNKHWEAGRLDKASELAIRYTSLRPKDPQGWAIAANVLLQAHKFEEAASVLNEARVIHPRDEDLLWLLARAYMGCGDLERAESLLRPHAESFPTSRLAPLGLVQVYRRMGKMSEARSWAAMADMATAPHDYGGEYELAMVIAGIPGERDRALRLLRHAVSGLPEFSLAHALLGVLVEKERPEEAEQLFQRARELWRSPHDFDDFLANSRDSLQNDRNHLL